MATVGSGGDYTTWASWYSAVGGTVSGVNVGEGLDQTFNEQLNLTGDTTDASNYLVVDAASGNKGDFTSYGSDGVRFEFTTNWTSPTVTTQDDYCGIQNVKAKTGGHDHDCFADINNATNSWIDSCIAYADTDYAGTTVGIINTHGAGLPTTNCLVVGEYSGGTTLDRGIWCNYCTVYNCTVSSLTGAGIGTGMYTNAGSPTVSNTISNSASDEWSGTYGGSSDYNVYENDTSTDCPGSNRVQGGTDEFVGSGSFEVDSGSAFYGAGTDLSGTFTTDAFGTTRTNWSIGYHDGTAGGGGGSGGVRSLGLLGVGA